MEKHKKQKRQTPDEIISTMKAVLPKKNKYTLGPDYSGTFAQTGPIIDLRQKPHEAMTALKSKQTQNYNDRLKALKQRENKLVKQGNQQALAQVRQARRIYAREQRRFNLTYAQIWLLFGPVFERWEKV